MSPLGTLIVGLAGDLLQFALSKKTEQEILESLAERLAETAKAIAALPGVQADRWKEIHEAWANR